MLSRVVRDGGYDEIIEGGQRGADALAFEWAQAHGVAHKPFLAKWHALGKKAGPMRNRQMAVYAKEHNGGLVAFLGNVGTADMLKQAQFQGLRIEYNENE